MGHFKEFELFISKIKKLLKMLSFLFDSPRLLNFIYFWISSMLYFLASISLSFLSMPIIRGSPPFFWHSC